ncbi:beta-lactamase family protein [Acidiferrimicrobium sp. IK]|uniref:serine hydrolase domain-containing protein n=1 Tax=Acidiferrimicrobium sp. IK TaxID=2871700 RepID=UPI0021CB091B|nr:serine hydrolase domain-containing protein [Acidiferrimicrobium sp. IK]MCU4185326.1 beta-lactamase family protein [Acidiferrimicrobium sp. IK]
MAELKVDVDPDEVGFDGERLARIDRHMARYVDEGLLAGWLVAVARNGHVAHLSTCGQRDVESGAPVEADTVWRLYSMTKPVTSVAAMMLYEEGAFELKDPVSRWIPSLSDMRVWRGGTPQAPSTAPATEPIRVWHLLTHTAGLTYGFHYNHPVDARYRAAGFEWGTPKGMDLTAVVDAYAEQPLLFEPGAEWNYSVATDVLGRLVEVISGQSLDEFFASRIFAPLGMTDTAFYADEARRDRLATLYVRGADGKATATPMGQAAARQPDVLSGGGGLVGTAGDYLRFTEMLRRRGELDGARLLGTRTVDYMTRNHLPGNADLEGFGRRLFAETAFDGVGFGLGFSVVLDPAAGKGLDSRGSYGWGGAASTAFWVDPEEEISAVFMTQLLPSSTYPLRSQLKQLVQQALVD